MALHTYLQQYAPRAAGALGGDIEVSITVREHALSLLAASSSPAAARCDQSETRADDGPCIEAAAQGVVHVVPSVAEEFRWAPWRKQAELEGFARSVAVPGDVGPGVRISLNLYSRAREEWSQHVIETAEVCAQLIAAGVRLHLQFADLDDAAAGLYRTMSDSAAVEQAVGVIMASNDCSADEARRRLRASAELSGVSERVVAEAMLRSLDLGGRGDIIDGRGA